MGCRRHLILTACVLITACGSSDGDAAGWSVQAGAVVFAGDTSDVSVSSDTVQVGEPVRVGVTTFGGGCTRAAGMSADVTDLDAVLVPRDSIYFPGPGEGCTQELRFHEHSAEVSFSRAGTARILVQAKANAPGAARSEDVELEQTLVVVK